jgi:hypothetical protein
MQAYVLAAALHGMQEWALGSADKIGCWMVIIMRHNIVTHLLDGIGKADNQQRTHSMLGPGLP